jgi:hypothetical protein
VAVCGSVHPGVVATAMPEPTVRRRRGLQLVVSLGATSFAVITSAVLFEIESLEAARYFPGAGEESEEFTRFFEQHAEAAAAMEKWDKYSPFDSETDITTDYVAVAE